MDTRASRARPVDSISLQQRCARRGTDRARHTWADARARRATGARRRMSLTGLVPDSPGPDALYEGLVGWAERLGRAVYSHQEEAVSELCCSSNVILTTPTGSGKSLVAVAAHFTAMADGRVTFYT